MNFSHRITLYILRKKNLIFNLSFRTVVADTKQDLFTTHVILMDIEGELFVDPWDYISLVQFAAGIRLTL